MSSPSDNERKMTLGEAAQYLNVSPRKVGSMVKAGLIQAKPDPLDRRRRLVLVADLDSLKRESLNRG
jgi:excisionase family DNA binding protein